MRRIVVLICLLLMVACAVSPDDIPNTVPRAPILYSPENGQYCIDNTIEFNFSPAYDPEFDEVTYQIEFSYEESFSTIEERYEVPSTINVLTMERGQNYYWRVRGIDEYEGVGDYSEVFNFVTEGDGETNALPFPPQLVFPQEGSNLDSGTVSLQWNAIDADGDALVYDVYLGMDNPPNTLLEENLNVNTTSVTLNEEGLYYWRVIAKDPDQGQSIGQVWTFTVNN